MAFVFANPTTPTSPTPIELAQLHAIDALYRVQPRPDGSLVAVDPASCTRYEVSDGGVHRYDAYVIGGWQPFVVFAPGGSVVLAWWSDQGDSSEGFADADAVYAAYELAIA